MNQIGHILSLIALIIIAAVLLFSPGSSNQETWYTWKVIALIFAVLGLLLELIPLIRR